MKILVSACLLGENCKYNGGNNLCEKVSSLAVEHELIIFNTPILQIIARGHNMTEMLNAPTAHAEMLSLTAATNAMGGKYLTECTGNLWNPDECMFMANAENKRAPWRSD